MNRSLNFLHLTTFYPPYSFGGDAMYIYRLAHALGDARHHVGVIHCIDSYHLQHPGELEPRLGSPEKIYTTHEHWLICPMPVRWKFDERVGEKPECLKRTILGKRPPQLWRYTNFIPRMSRQVDQFRSPSRFTANMPAECGFSKPVAHLAYFIDRVDRDWKEPGTSPHDKPYFLFVGRLEAIKGLQLLIKAWEKVEDYDLPDVGTGNYQGQLKAQASANSRIKFLGAKPQRELGRLYFHAIACIVPSITYETFGIIIIESFARKAPVIVQNLGALAEVVHESNGGFVYKTEEEWLAAISRIASSPQLRNELGENGYRAFVELWSREAHLDLYFEFLGNAAKMKFGLMPWEASQLAASQLS
jgi:glycosyltransferase involved in cell wall biosynthesis